MNPRLLIIIPVVLILGILGGCATSSPPSNIHFYKSGETEIEGIEKSESTEFEVPFHFSPSSAIIVDLKLNAKKTVSFWLDTGNPTCIMDNTVAADLHIR